MEEIPDHLIENISKNSIVESQKIILDQKQSGKGKSNYSNRDFGTKKELPDSNNVSGNLSDVFQTGDTVIHKAFGEGLIVSIQKMGNDQLIEIAFDKVGTKKLMAKFAKLQKK
ncbi:ATP-dependent DNA helicase PcrA [bioreactor metagenome]|uniref:ATP-dependent DNA helicase PcrA n=1 Tax=bioreactor metagenome TaxID=1076179 RepID=A0A645GD35_9ZZZZ